MSNTQKSSVEWLEQELKKIPFVNVHEVFVLEVFEQAKAMHKEEIENAYREGWMENIRCKHTPNRYYNETFGGNNEDTNRPLSWIHPQRVSRFGYFSALDLQLQTTWKDGTTTGIQCRVCKRQKNLQWKRIDKHKPGQLPSFVRTSNKLGERLKSEWDSANAKHVTYIS
jgi:hypothetical protein